MTGLDARAGEKALRQAAEFVQRFDGTTDGRITCRLGHMLLTLVPSLYVESFKKSTGTQLCIHIHLAETKLEVQELIGNQVDTNRILS